MKGLLLKEFYVWLQTRWFLLALTAVTAVIIAFSNNSIMFSSLGVLIGGSFNPFLVDEKSGWSKYCKALPGTPFQRVASKYIFTSCEILAGIIMVSAAIMFSSHNYGNTLSPLKSYIAATAYISCILIALAIALPLSSVFNKTLKSLISLIPLLACIYILMSIVYVIRYNLPGWVEELFTEKIWIYPAIILVSLLILAASMMLSVTIEARKDKAYRRSFGIKAAALSAASVAICAAVFATLYFGGAFPDPTFGDEVSSSKIEKTQEEYSLYYDLICAEANTEKSGDKVSEALKSLGFIENPENPGTFLSEGGRIKVNVGTDIKTGTVKRITAASLITNHKIIENASDADFEKASDNFTVGMTEKELHVKIKEMELIPTSVKERITFKNQHQRNYYFSFSTENHNSSEYNPAVYNISIEVKNGKVSNVETSVYSSTVADGLETIAERQLAAKEEMRILMENYCISECVELSFKENLQILGSLGFTRPDDESTVFTAESGYIKVRITADQKTGDVDYIYIGGSVGENRIDSATSEELAEICEGFSDCKNEEELHQKFYELEFLPYEIFETSGTDGSHTRSYKLLYIIDSYNGGEGVDYKIDIDVVNGEVSEVFSIES